MSADKEEKFDKMLFQALQKHSELVPADFTNRILRQIREAEEQRILARVVMEERLTLAGCIVLGIMAIVAVVVFPSIAVNFKELVGTSIEKVAQTVGYEWGSRSAASQWQLLYAVFAGVLGFAIYSITDLLVSDNQR